MSTEAVLDALRAIWELLGRHEVPAALAEGLALAAWKHPRTTRDADLLVGIDIQDAAELK